MNKMLVAVFESETAAYEGLSALKDLHHDGDITLYASAVFSKNEKGELQLKTADERGPVHAATGMLAGSLIGLIGGPPGLAIGAVAGFAGGLALDFGSDDINLRFVHEVSRALTKEKIAIVAEIDESWTIPVDTRLENAMIFRGPKNERMEVQLARESQAIAAEYQKLKEELIEAKEERKAQIQSAIGKLEAKALAINDQLSRKQNELRDEFEAKVKAIEEQMKDARKKRKEKMGKRIEEMNADYIERSRKIKQVSKLFIEAFASKEEGHLV